ncbi:hypothetical protein WR25_00832 [Diploscapter pachys]|uniref:Uncharacterized protein n=1 Tax=Diploscapter pachys TaxID=2018661 RepID=A0A2A2JV64_9BILA|nr:hypothetical protein WR25_00832 [Diploscapter pachys]
MVTVSSLLFLPNSSAGSEGSWRITPAILEASFVCACNSSVNEHLPRVCILGLPVLLFHHLRISSQIGVLSNDVTGHEAVDHSSQIAPLELVRSASLSITVPARRQTSQNLSCKIADIIFQREESTCSVRESSLSETDFELNLLLLLQLSLLVEREEERCPRCRDFDLERRGVKAGGRADGCMASTSDVEESVLLAGLEEYDEGRDPYELKHDEGIYSTILSMEN